VNEKLPFRFRIMNTCDVKIAMSKKEGTKNNQTYRWRDLGDSSKQEPNETLTNRNLQ
jgi:hypothetical protein